MAEGQRMTTTELVAKVMAGEHGDFVREAVALIAHELMEAEISAEVGAELCSLAGTERLPVGVKREVPNLVRARRCQGRLKVNPVAPVENGPPARRRSKSGPPRRRLFCSFSVSVVGLAFAACRARRWRSGRSVRLIRLPDGSGASRGRGLSADRSRPSARGSRRGGRAGRPSPRRRRRRRRSHPRPRTACWR
jgi:hypothetical protein